MLISRFGFFESQQDKASKNQQKTVNQTIPPLAASLWSIIIRNSVSDAPQKKLLVTVQHFCKVSLKHDYIIYIYTHKLVYPHEIPYLPLDINLKNVAGFGLFPT